eukprot:gene6764-7525_t
MKVVLSLILLFGLAIAEDNLENLLNEAVKKSACNGFKCNGRYEQCEIISGSPLCVKNCPDCRINTKKSEQVCGSDGNTYVNHCLLQQNECMQNTFIDKLCEGKCPCDPKEVVDMDPKLVHKLQKMRMRVHLEKRFKEEMKLESASEKAFKELKPAVDKKSEYLDITTEDELQNMQNIKMKKWQKKKFEHQKEVKKFQEKSSKQQNTKKMLKPDACTKKDLADLPGRLIDWFHVLKSNTFKKEKLGKTLKEMKFLDAKLRAMYVSLACKQDPLRPDSEVFCLQPVEWMFDYLDTNNDNILQDKELADIEEADGEHCMKKFFLGCDRNRNGTVEKVEFCRCLCVEPPCTKAIEDIPTLLVSGVPQPVPGLFAPKCDEDGFYIAKQCTDKECFCVDRNGQEVEETRVKGKNLDCADNTIRQDARPVKKYDSDIPEYLLP